MAILEIGERTYNRIDDKGEREKMIFRYADATSVEMVPGLLRRTLVEGKSMILESEDEELVNVQE